MTLARDLALYFAVMCAAMSVLSLPLAPATLLAVKSAPPLAVASAAAVAAAIAAVFDHWFVRRAFELRALGRLRRRKLFLKAEDWARVAPFWTTAVFAALPIPFTIVRVLMPLSGYPRHRYVAAVALGRFPRIFVIAYVGAALEIPRWILVWIFAVTLAGAALVALARRLGWLRSREDDPPAPPSPDAAPVAGTVAAPAAQSEADVTSSSRHP